ncbi:cytochrome P450 [Dentipellis sp. KUC8613]|nr:cytochrome P450 [Dentipellis sp. KUC8613]
MPLQSTLASIDTNLVVSSLSAVALSFVLYTVARALRAGYAAWSSPLRDLRGPPSVSWLSGSVDGVFELDAVETFAAWIREYGPTFRFKSFGNMNKLITTDVKAIAHVLSHGMEFPKPQEVHFILGQLLGDGLLSVEGHQHKLQRRLLNPAFATQRIRNFCKVFVDKSITMRDVLMAKTTNEELQKDGFLEVDIFDWLSRVSLDMIGQAGFDYSFNALTAPDDEPNELYEAVRTMMAFDSFNIAFLLAIAFPPARLIPTKRTREVGQAFATVRRISAQIVADRKAAVLSSVGGSEKDVETSSIEGRDLISLLIKANMAVDLPENARLSEDDLVSQIPTLIVAGHETTSTSLSWTLLLLCRNKKAQEKLREELRAFPTDFPTLEELGSFPYLDAVVREGLRVHNPVRATERVALEDCVIPVQDEYVDRHGRVRREIRLNKGDNVFIPIRELHMMKEIWGEDAEEFKPERWENLPEIVKSMPGVFHPLMAFNAGPHACIGYRFSLAEAKAILFTLIRAFEFEMAVPEDRVVRKTNIVGRPHLVDEIQSGPQLPMLIRPVQSD